MAGGVFINYRRALNRKDAQLLQNALQRHFGRRGVFLDLRDLDAGVHWLHELERQVDASAAMVALIGRGWADVKDEKGNRRLDNPNDFVRFELARAFTRRIPVLPVLIDGATVPDKAQLPDNLLELAYRQAEHLRSETFVDDADRIALKLRVLIAQSRRRGLSYLAAGAAVVVALGVGIATGPMLLDRLGVPFPGIYRPGDDRLRAEFDAARDGLAKAVRERDVLRSDLAASQSQVEAAKTAATQSAAALAAATKARDEALAQAKSAKADADEWRQKHAALDAQIRQLRADLDAARDALAKATRERDSLRADLAASQKQLDAAKKATPTPLARIEPPSDPAQAVKPGSGQSFHDCPDVCPEMVVVPKAKYWMGEGSSKREVEIKETFAVGKFEVTFDEWEACVQGGGCKSNPRPSHENWGKGRRPVINVSWHDAKEYVAWLSERTGKTYRLLSEAEWEYAARAGTTTVYSWGDDVGKGNANCGSCGSQWDGKQTAPVGSFRPNAWGLYDMHGNVWEWCEDNWHPDYKGAPQDGSVWKGGHESLRVLRGGSWDDNPVNLRSAVRGRIRPDYRSGNGGFRVARTL